MGSSDIKDFNLQNILVFLRDIKVNDSRKYLNLLMSQLASIGIDFGNRRSVIAEALRGGVKILNNKDAHRETQNVIGFTSEERFIREQGALQQMSNFKNSVGFFNRFFGIQGTQQFRDEEIKWLIVLTQINESGRTVFEPQCQINQSKLQSRGTQIFESSNVCISVPAYCTESERKALIDACKISGISLENFLNETTAIAINYGLLKNKLGYRKTSKCFANFGHSKFSAFVGSFYKDKAQVLAQVSESNLGARDINWLLFEKFVTQFENTKGKLPILEAIEKAIKSYLLIQKLKLLLNIQSKMRIS